MQLTPLHTPVEMRAISNIAHVIEGVVLGAAALIIILQAAGRFDEGRAKFLWPGLIVFAGTALLLYLVIPHHGLERTRLQWSFVFGDPQQRQHVIIASLIIVAGVVEILARAGRLHGSHWPLAWPIALAVVGTLFIVHQQHGTGDAVARATLVHRWLGTTLVLAGTLAGIGVVLDRRRGALAVGGGVLLFIAALLLIAYREPEGAYHGSMPGMKMDAPR